MKFMFLRLFDRWKSHRRGLRVGLLVLVWSLCLGWGLAQAKPAIVSQNPPQNPSQVTAPNTPASSPEIGTVDVVPQQFQLGQQLYLENCATCHLGIPPAVMPTQTWRNLIQDPQHYGVQIQPLRSPDLELVWRYLSTFSRLSDRNEAVPYRVRESRYFKALHPKVEFPQPVTLNSCVACHPAAREFNYRRVSGEWE
ncbi:diheme cytochrome C [Leptolyngbya ohadii]|uniref:diheme cytochrome C n=1 Tax=Leptolyngbya ohadii TaxID=1962290 RepID=UPI0021F2215A|nr:diheme cytochrome C [Leptolyngbya ohadii]